MTLGISADWRGSLTTPAVVSGAGNLTHGVVEGQAEDLSKSHQKWEWKKIPQVHENDEKG
jgi:hypothetical protein